jgi:hypothetical protein
MPIFQNFPDTIRGSEALAATSRSTASARPILAPITTATACETVGHANIGSRNRRSMNAFFRSLARNQKKRAIHKIDTVPLKMPDLWDR